ncbi:MAG: epimerase [Spirochaetia bacterium]|nr:epimerase [Spirochaetia bacterium]
MKLKVIVTGATGMVGEGVLHECLNHPDVEKVLIINRKPLGLTHPKLKEIVHGNFYELASAKDKLAGYNACFFCLGASSVGMKEADFHRVTYDLTLHFAETVLAANPGMTFIYVSGASTDSTEKGKTMWARVKGKIENKLLSMPFKNAYMFRPAMMKPTPGLKNTLTFYKFLGWAFPIMRFLSPNFVSTLADVGLAMIKSVTLGSDKKILEVADINALAKK